METLSYYFDRKIFKIEIERTQNKNMYLKMKGSKVVCLAPYNLSELEIKKFVDKHALKFYEHSKKVIKRELYSIEQDFLYLFGKKYKIVRLSGSVKKAEIIDDNIYIHTVDNSDSKIESGLKQFLKEELSEYIDEKQNEFEEKLNVPVHSKKFIYKCGTWGSNYVNEKKIIYSTKLAHFRKEIIDYVIVHELVHNIEPNHSKSFWDIVSSIVPNWKLLRNELKSDSEIKEGGE